jgi:hypothetical protein
LMWIASIQAVQHDHTEKGSDMIDAPSRVSLHT